MHTHSPATLCSTAKLGVHLLRIWAISRGGRGTKEFSHSDSGFLALWGGLVWRGTRAYPAKLGALSITYYVPEAYFNRLSTCGLSSISSTIMVPQALPGMTLSTESAILSTAGCGSKVENKPKRFEELRDSSSTANA